MRRERQSIAVGVCYALRCNVICTLGPSTLLTTSTTFLLHSASLTRENHCCWESFVTEGLRILAAKALLNPMRRTFIAIAVLGSSCTRILRSIESECAGSYSSASVRVREDSKEEGRTWKSAWPQRR